MINFFQDGRDTQNGSDYEDDGEYEDDGDYEPAIMTMMSSWAYSWNKNSNLANV